MNIRKGKKIVGYDYSISAEWKMENEKESLEGVVGVSMESTSEKEPIVDIKFHKGSNDEDIKNAIKRSLGKIISQFAQELSSK